MGAGGRMYQKHPTRLTWLGHSKHSLKQLLFNYGGRFVWPTEVTKSRLLAKNGFFLLSGLFSTYSGFCGLDRFNGNDSGLAQITMEFALHLSLEFYHTINHRVEG